MVQRIGQGDIDRFHRRVRQKRFTSAPVSCSRSLPKVKQVGKQRLKLSMVSPLFQKSFTRHCASAMIVQDGLWDVNNQKNQVKKIC